MKDAVKGSALKGSARVKGRLPPTLVRCPGCGLHLYPQARTCPHCRGDLAVLNRAQLKAMKKVETALAQLSKIFDRA